MATTRSKRKWDRARFYVIEGKRLPSVTTILDAIPKPGLMYWYANQERAYFQAAMALVLRKPNLTRPKIITAVTEAVKGIKAAERAKKKASDLGHDFHAGVNWYLKREMGDRIDKPELSDHAKEMLGRWLSWYRKSGLQVLAAEQTIYCMDCGFAGTMDFYGKKGKTKVVLDWKTGNAIYPEAHLQNIAYRHACHRLGMKTQAGAVVRIPKEKGKVEVVSVNEEFDLDDFLAIYEAWKVQRRMEGLTLGGRKR